MDGLEVELDDLEHIICGQKEPDSLDFRLLRRLTENFSEFLKIGEGGCGEVYKGVLPNGKVIAVKKLKRDHLIDEKLFLREVDSMIKIRHQNVVRFLGYCSEIKEKAVLMDGKIVMAEEREKLLCFPYISNGSLDKHLTDELRGFEWHTRYQIIKGICDGLLHLHKEKGILHMDLKPANILLGDQMVPKITDFGVSRIDGKTHITSAERLFSRGYAAPEYIDTGVRSWKSDIYSLGIIMIELVTGSRKIPNTTKVFRRWRHRWNKSSKHTPLLYLQVKKCLELAVSCQEINPVNRPFIWDVVRELNELDSWDGQITESSLEKIISSSDDMLGIEPLELYFPLAHEKQVSCSIELTNDTDYYMAFRIANTSLLPFSIQPDRGIVAPGSMFRSTIILPAQEMARLKNHREGFIVQSTRVDGSLTAVDMTDDTFNDKGGYTQKKNDDGDKVVDEVNLTVLFDMLHVEHQKDQLNLRGCLDVAFTRHNSVAAAPHLWRTKSSPQPVARIEREESCGAMWLSSNSLQPNGSQPSCGGHAPVAWRMETGTKHPLSAEMGSLVTSSQWCEEKGIEPHSRSKSDCSPLEVGGSRLAIEALVRDLSSSSLYERKSAAVEIRSLAKESTDSRILLAESSAIPALVKLLSSKDLETQEHAVTALLNLSIYDQNKELIVVAGAIVPIIQVLRMGSMEARENAAAAIFSLSLVDDNKIMIGSTPGAIEALVELLQSGSSRGKKDAATALFYLCKYQANKVRAVRAGILVPLIRMLRLSSRNEAIDEALTILSVLVSHHECKTAISKAHAIPSLIDLLRSGQDRNKENAAAILLALCKKDAENLACVGRLGAQIPLTELAKTGTDRAKRKATSILKHLSRLQVL